MSLPFGKIVLIFIFFSVYSPSINGYIYFEKYVLENVLGRIPNRYSEFLESLKTKKKKVSGKEPRIKSARSLRIPKIYHKWIT